MTSLLFTYNTSAVDKPKDESNLITRIITI